MIDDKARLDFVKKLTKSVNGLAEKVFNKKVEVLPAKKTVEVFKKADAVERELQAVQLLQETVDRLLKVAYTKGFIDEKVKAETIKVQEMYDQYFLDFVKPLTIAFEKIQKQEAKFNEELQELSAETLGQEVADVYSTEFSKLKKDKTIKKRVDEIFTGVDTYGKLVDKQLELNVKAKNNSFENVPLVAEVKLVELNDQLSKAYQEQINNTKKR